MGQIFLSYAREDRSCTAALARVLEEAGHSVWWDRHIDSGAEFAAQIEAELDRADVVVVAWSKESVKSRWVRDEAGVGGDTGRLVPVSIDGTLPPMGFRQFHTMDLAGWKGGKRDRRTGEFLQSVERRLTCDQNAPVEKKPAPRPRPSVSGHRRIMAIAAALLLVIAAGAAVFLLNSRNKMSGPLPKPTIGLLPFTAASSDPELRDLGSQSRDSLAHALSQSGIPVRLLETMPQDGRTAGDFIMSGELSRNADKIVASVRLNEATQGVTVLSRQVEAGTNEVHNLPERIGAQIASVFNGATLLGLDRRHPIDPTLLAELLADSNDQLQDYQTAVRLAAKAPDLPSTQILLAFATGFVLGDLPRNQRAEAVTKARQAADRGLALAPEFGDTYGTWCSLHSDAQMAECEDRVRAGIAVDPDAPYLNTFLRGLLLTVGRFDEATEVAKLSHTHDPYDPIKLGQMFRNLEIAGDSDGASDLYKQAAIWWPDHKNYFVRNRLLGLLDRGDFEGMQRLEKEVGPNIFPPNYPDTQPIVLAIKSKSPAAVRVACARDGGFLLMTRCMIAFAKVGDLDDAYGIADKLYPRRIGRTPAETERIWLDDPDGGGGTEFVTSPAAAPMRRDPRFLQLAERRGLLAYWRSGRPPDFCEKRPERVCSELLKRH